MTMGLQPMHPDDWMEIDEYYQEEMSMRQELLRDKRDIVLASRPEVVCPLSMDNHSLQQSIAAQQRLDEAGARAT